MVAIPNNDAYMYSTIKKMCYLDKEHPVPCQVITAKNMRPAKNVRFN